MVGIYGGVLEGKWWGYRMVCWRVEWWGYRAVCLRVCGGDIGRCAGGEVSQFAGDGWNMTLWPDCAHHK